jgi:hypothetical protein
MPAKRTIPCVCQRCGDHFLESPYEIARGGGRYCGRSCAAKSRAVGGIARSAPRPILFDADGLTARIPLHAQDGTLKAYALIDTIDAEWAGQWTWGLTNSGYAARAEIIDSHAVKVMLHRELLGLPMISDGRQGDHVNHDRLDDRRLNLRIASPNENRQNLRSYRGSTSTYRGVHWSRSKQKWQATIAIGGKQTKLGLFNSEQDAAEAARAARMRLMPFATD